MRTYRTHDYGRAQTEKEKIYYGGGIPSRYWHEDYKKIAPISFSFTCIDEKKKEKLVIISDQMQQQWLEKLKSIDELHKPYLIIMGGLPTDEKAMVMACRFAKIARDSGSRVHVFDISDYDVPDEKDQLIVLYGLSSTVYTQKRMMDIQDIVRKYDDKCRILVVEGNPGDFAVNHLKIRANAYIGFVGGLSIEREL